MKSKKAGARRVASAHRRRAQHATERAESMPSPPVALEDVPDQLRMIADLIESAMAVARLGEVSAALHLPSAAELSPRQWEIVSRLIEGERVPTIASAMYLSPSTVRNHLSAIFAKVGVHSQDELITLYRQKLS